MKKKAKKIIYVIVVIVLILIVGFFLMLHSRQKKAQDEVLAESKVSQASTNEIEWNGKKYTYNDQLINILFLGIDKAEDIDSSYMPGDAGQADCIMLLSLNKETKEARILQINRNTMTKVDVYSSDGESYGAIDAQLATQYAYCIGGSRSCWATEKTVKNLLYNLPINGYLALSVDGIAEINDAIGGVTVTMTDADAQINPEFQSGQAICLKGEKAETYVRYRDTEQFDSNSDRMRRQVSYITAMIRQMRSRGGSAMYDILSPFLDRYIVTDLDSDQIDALSSYNYLTDEVQYLPGESVMGEKYEEFHVNEDQLQEQLIETYYKPVE